MDGEQVFLQALSNFYLHQQPDQHIIYDSFMVTCVTALRYLGHPHRNLELLRRKTTLYSHMLIAFQIIVPGVEKESISCFVEEIRAIINYKQWTGIHCNTRNAHVTSIWKMIIKSRWTSQTFVVQSLLKADKLWEGINMVYVFLLMDYHSNALAIYSWALQLLYALDLD